MTNVIRALQRFNADREPERLALKYHAMRTDAFAFLRGTCHLFYRQLPNDKLFSKAPRAWLCGDLHLENFGSYKGDTRLAYFDLNDFDEAILGAATLDLVRLLTSVLVGAPMLRVRPDEAVTLCRVLLDSYVEAIATGKARWIERETSEGPVQTLLNELHGRMRPAFLDSRTVRKGKSRQLRLDGKKALPVTSEQREQVTALLERFATKQPDPAFYKVIDVARRVAGTGSLGVNRFVILVRGKGSPDGNYLLDLKQALPSSLQPRIKIEQPSWRSEAHRVVAIMQRMQAVSMAFLHPLRFHGEPYVLRGLQPSEDRITLGRSRYPLKDVESVMCTMGRLVAWAQLRSSGRDGSATADELIAFAVSARWRKDILVAAQDCAQQNQSDWTTFSRAYDEGVFNLRTAVTHEFWQANTGA